MENLFLKSPLVPFQYGSAWQYDLIARFVTLLVCMSKSLCSFMPLVSLPQLSITSDMTQ